MPATKLASLSRRLAFAGESRALFDRLFAGPLVSLARIGDWQTPRLPDHLARIAFDLFECLRSATSVPSIGNAELALWDAHEALPQHPRYRSYWYDDVAHSMVGMLIGVDLIRRGPKYYVLENNLGPSLYPRRRELYDTRLDPLVSGVASMARTLGFETLMPIAFRWAAPYVAEFRAAGREFDVCVEPMNCPFEQRGGAGRIAALPRNLPEKTMVVIHSGLMTPAIRYLDDKWYTAKWLGDAIDRDLGACSSIAIPRTDERLFVPPCDEAGRWPNLVVKLAGSARSRHVIAGRFENENDARRLLGINGLMTVPRKLRAGFATSLLFGGDRVIYQEFVPPELDRDGHAQAIRLHLFVSPLRTEFLSAHLRVSRRPVPARVPAGIIAEDDSYIWNDATYRPLTAELERELRVVAEQLGAVMQRALARRFESGSAIALNERDESRVGGYAVAAPLG